MPHRAIILDFKKDRKIMQQIVALLELFQQQPPSKQIEMLQIYKSALEKIKCPVCGK